MGERAGGFTGAAGTGIRMGCAEGLPIGLTEGFAKEGLAVGAFVMVGLPVVGLKDGLGAAILVKVTAANDSPL